MWAERTKNRNRNSQRFFVANVPVASQTAMGSPFSSKDRKKKSQSLATSCRKENRKAFFGGGRTLLGAKEPLRFFTCDRNRNCRKIANAWCTQFVGKHCIGYGTVSQLALLLATKHLPIILRRPLVSCSYTLPPYLRQGSECARGPLPGLP